jgi:general stress protein 26
VSASGVPQAAVVGVVVADDFSLIFDTLDSTRKAANLRHNPNVALVIGGWAPGDERSVQYEGVADVPDGAELEEVRRHYVAVFPDGRDRLGWKGIMHVRVRPKWLRYSDYTKDPPEILEFTAVALRALR